VREEEKEEGEEGIFSEILSSKFTNLQYYCPQRLIEIQ
jgi:hypothetical protein